MRYLTHLKDFGKRGGWPAFRRRVRALLGGVFLLLPAVMATLLVRAMRPFILIRIGRLNSGRFGHFAANTEVYLCERDSEHLGRRPIDLFCHQHPVCNRQLKIMWNRELHVCDLLVDWMERVNQWIPGGRNNSIPWRTHGDRDLYGLFDGSLPHLRFNAEEETLGRKTLEAMGIPRGNQFVCFHARDSAYLDYAFPNRDFSRHDYRDSEIQSYIPAVEELTRRGYSSLRMGSIVKEPITSPNSMVIDYATKSRTEFLDIYLSANCRFYIGSSDGLHTIPMIFRRPLVAVNFVPLEFAYTWSSNYLLVFKKLWLRGDRRYLTFREILESGMGRALATQQYEEQGIELIDNTPTEILDAAVEMDDRLNGTWETKEEDEELQRRFWSLFPPSELNQVFRSRIGAQFLRDNRDLLD